MYLRSFILYRDYSNSLTLSNVGEPFLKVECVTPHGKEMLEIEKTFIKKGNSWANSGVACALSVLFTPLDEMISLMKSSFPSTVFCVLFGCIFHLGGVLDTKI